MAALETKPYIKAQPPKDPQSHYQYLEEELKKLQASVRAIEAAILQLQVFTGVS